MYANGCKMSNSLIDSNISRLGGVMVSVLAMDPRFAGLNSADAIYFLGDKNPQHTFLRRGSNAGGPT
jgi:hypothetical protein